MESVLYRTFRDFGYTDKELRDWDHAAGAPELQLMGTFAVITFPSARSCCSGGWLRRGRSLRLHELGITAVLPGFSESYRKASDQVSPVTHRATGRMAGFERPDWLDPRDPMFSRFSLYSSARALRTVGRV